MSETTKWLMQAAEEIRKEGHAGWGNTCEQAAERMTELEQQLAELRSGLKDCYDLMTCGFEDEVADIMAALLKQGGE